MTKQALVVLPFQFGRRKASTAATEPVGSNLLLAGYLAHEFLTKGTLFGEMMSPRNLDDDDPYMEVRDLGRDHASGGFDGNSVEERATAPMSSSSATGNVRASGEQPALAGNLKGLPNKRPTPSKSASPATARQKIKVSEDRRVSAGKATVQSEDESTFPVTTPESPSSFACERASTENDRVLKEPSGAATGGGSTRLLPPWISGSEQWGGGKWKDDARKKNMNKKSDMIPLKDVIEAIIRNSGETEEEDAMIENLSYVEILKSIGIKFPE